jgi:excisionase family DNA binding protein
MELPDRLLTVHDLAEYLGVPATTLYQWRYRREGPRGFRVGRHIRYQLCDVTEWVERQIENGIQ